jgi:hypothetical protein
VSDKGDIELSVRVGPWIDGAPLNAWEGPGREMRVRVSEGDEAIITWCRLTAGAVERGGQDYVEAMRRRTISGAIESFMNERKVFEAAEKLGREMAAGQFDHRPSFLMPEDDYA